MLATAASCLSSSDMWRHHDDKSKHILKLKSWRDRRGSKENGVVSDRVQTKEMLCNWSIRGLGKAKKAEGAEETRVYGDCMPAEWRLQKMYKQLKVDNNTFTTWLVESVYPCNGSLPPYITLSRKQTKEHDKYEIIVNNFTELARQTQQVPPTMFALVDRLIAERSEYSHWMSRKSTDNLARFSDESHIHYINVLKEVRNILAERMEPQTTTSSHAESPSPTPRTNTSPQSHSSALGKRKGSFTSVQNPNQRKTVKTASTPPTPKHTVQDHAQPSIITSKQQQAEWRQLVIENCDKVVNNGCAPQAKPMSYAAALRVAIVA